MSGLRRIERADLLAELTGRILPYWMEHVPDNACGGYYGRIDGEGHLHPEALKGCVLHARILWTFAAAARTLKRPDYLPYAERAYGFLLRAFNDPLHGGVFWSADRRGHPVDMRKQVYANAFAIYALAEYAQASGDLHALDLAHELFELLERHSRDGEHGGYLEAFTRGWRPLADVRLSAKDENEKKSMNTHLHVLEAYAALFRARPGQLVKEALKALLDVFVTRIVNAETGHLNLFLTERWARTSTRVSYGHEVEASWLLDEAAEAVGEKGVVRRVRSAAAALAEAACEGLQPDGSLINERDAASGHADLRRDWWPQAEAVVGFLNAWQRTG